MPERQVITSLTGTAAPLLTVNAANPRELDFAALFLPREWKKVTPYVTDFQRILPNGQSALNQELQYEVAKLANLVTDLIIEANLPPITVAPVGAPVSYSDWLGFALQDFFRVHFGSNLVYDRHPLDLYLRVRKTLGIERLESLRQQVFGDRTTAQRQTLLQNGTGNSPLLIPLYLPFCDDPMMALPILTLSQKTRFIFKTKTLNDFIYNPIGATVTPNGPFEFNLLLQVIHTTGPEGEKLLDLSRHPAGISYMIHQHVRQESNIANTATNFRQRVPLNGITKPLVSISWMLIPERMLSGAGNTHDYFFFNPQPPLPIPPGMNPYSPILEWRIDANGLEVQRSIRRTYSTYHMYDLYDTGFAGEDIYTQNYAWWPHAINAATGYLDYTNLNNPSLEILFGVGGTGVDPVNPQLAQVLRCLINAKDYNFWFFKGGNWTRTFN